MGPHSAVNSSRYSSTVRCYTLLKTPHSIQGPEFTKMLRMDTITVSVTHSHEGPGL